MELGLLEYLLIALTSILLTGLITKPIRNYAIKFGAMDIPNLERKSQTDPTPYFGGIAIALVVTCFVLVGSVFSEDPFSTLKLSMSILLPAIFLGLVGLIDDLKNLPPWPRLFLQTLTSLVCSTILITTGTQGIIFQNELLNFFATVLWFVVVCNALNFFDNVDGGAATTVMISSLSISFIAFNEGQYLICGMAIVIFGSTTGFLVWNLPPAKIYLGDAGALFLGLLLAILTLRLKPNMNSSSHSIGLPLLILAAPLLDTAVVITSRILKGNSPMLAGRDHLSHRLAKLGFTKVQTILILSGISSFFSISAILIYLKSPSYVNHILLISALTWLSLFFFFLIVERRKVIIL